MKKRIQLLIIPIILIFTLACNVPVSIYTFFDRSVSGDERDKTAEEEETLGMKVVPDSEYTADGQGSSNSQLTPAEKQIQGIHSYSIEGYNNIAFGGNEWTTNGKAEVLFESNGVKYRYIDSGETLQFMEQTKENHYQHVDDQGNVKSLRCWDEGFEFESTSATGTIVRLTFYLDE